VKSFYSQIKLIFDKAKQGKLEVGDLAFPSVEQSLPWIAAFLGGFLLAAVVGWGAAFQLMPQARRGKIPASAQADAANVELPIHPDMSQFEMITRRNLFDSSGVGASDQKSDVCAPTKSGLPLRLKGVIFGGTSETSLVLLESQSTREVDSFILGETVPGNAKISEITKDRVYLVQGPCPEYLDVDQPEQFKPRIADLSKRTQNAVAAGDSSKTADFSEDGFERRGDTVNVDKQWIEKTVTVDFAKTLQDAKATPNMVGGQVKGFLMTQIRSDSVYEKLGIQNGDVVRSINGIELNDAARAIQTLQAMRTETQLELTFEREGKTVTRKIHVK
jgi:general secretion pathway protein C